MAEVWQRIMPYFPQATIVRSTTGRNRAAAHVPLQSIVHNAILRTRGGGGGAWAWKPLPGKPLSPIPKPIGAGDLTQSKVFSGLRGAFMRGSHWELLFLHWEERGWVKL